MATGEMQEMYDEKSAIRQSYSAETFSDLSSQQVEPPRSFIQRFPKRYVVAIMAFLGFMCVYILRVNLSIAIVAMTQNKTHVVNGTEISMAEFGWDRQTQGLVLSSFFYGYIVTQLPGGWLATKVGGKYLFGAGILGTAVLTLITPPMTRLSIYLLIAVRVLEGLFEGVTYPCIHALWSKWAPPLERSKLATIAFSGSYFGTVLAMPVSGAIAYSIGWSWIFYITGLIGIIWFAAWCFLISESPATHPTISQSELDYINQTIGYTEAQTKGAATPWKSILLSVPVWAIVVAHFCENWGFYTLLTQLPKFLSDNFDYNLQEAGVASAAPYLAMAIIIQVGGQLADLARSQGLMSTTVTRKMFTATAFLSQTLFMMIAAYMHNAIGSVACITIAVGFGGFAWAGFAVNHLDIAPQYASLLMGLSNTFATIPGMVSPSLTGTLVKHGRPREWRIVFFITAALYCVGALIYVLLASGKRQKWAKVPEGYQQHLDTHSEAEHDQ